MEHLSINPINDSILSDFLQYLAHFKQYSNHTLSNYKRDILKFAEYAKKNTLNLNRFTHKDCRNYLRDLQDNAYSTATIHRKVAALRSFWTFLCQTHKASKNPWKDTLIPKKSHKLPTTLSENEMANFLNELPTETNIDTRNKALYELLYSTGLRVSELVNINLSDIQYDAHTIRSIGKGNTERLVLFSDTCKHHLLYYQNNIRPHWITRPTEALFLNTKGQRLTQRSVQRILKNATKKQGIEKIVTPHTLRHSFATDLYNGGAHLRAIQELLGHKQLSTTQIYTHISNKKIKEAYDKASPLGDCSEIEVKLI